MAGRNQGAPARFTIPPHSALLASLLVLGCSSSEKAKEQPPELKLGQKVPFPTTDWTVTTPEAMGMDSKVLEDARKYAFDFDADGDGVPDGNTQGVVVVRGGAIVAEWYAPGKDKDSYAASWSMAKSFTSTLVGIAIDQGLIPSVNVKLSQYFPEWVGTAKENITLRQTLQMQSGLAFVEDYASASDVVLMATAADELAYARALGVLVPPDTRWSYSSGDTELLGGVVEGATGKNPTDYGKEMLFGPIGMSPVDWWIDGATPQPHTMAYMGIDTPTRQFAKMGLLFLREGNWDGKQVVSKEWVHEATTTKASVNTGYAYQWWTADSNKSITITDLYYADGLDEQKIIVIPSLDLVIAKNSLYEKPPGPAAAPTGWISKFTPRGIGQYGTKSPLVWEDAALLAPIINSVKGGPRMDFTPHGIGGFPNDPVQCKVEAQSGYGAYCEAVHGCVCDTCASQFLECDANAACKAILQCAIEKGCRGIACATPCADVLASNGGASTGNIAVTLALKLSDCQNPCPISCAGDAGTGG